MSPVEYTPPRRTWIRDIAVGLAVSLGSDVVRGLVHVAVRLFG